MEEPGHHMPHRIPLQSAMWFAGGAHPRRSVTTTICAVLMDCTVQDVRSTMMIMYPYATAVRILQVWNVQPEDHLLIPTLQGGAAFRPSRGEQRMCAVGRVGAGGGGGQMTRAPPGRQTPLLSSRDMPLSQWMPQGGGGMGDLHIRGMFVHSVQFAG